ncbi:hypothetical protein B7932_10485 [Streptococcus agalactiae]|nr:hypothetical protein B7932_10485 [Streptococcus agalactiae]
MIEEQEKLDCLVDKIFQQEQKIIKKNNIITFLSILMIAINILNVALQDHYKLQITGLQSQLRRTQKQLKRASEQNQQQTKRIAELTGNGG